MSQLSEVCNALWRDTEGFVYLPIKTKDGQWKPAFAQWPNQSEQIYDYVVKAAAQSAEVYLSPVLWKRKPGPGEKLSKDMFLGTYCLWTELDGNAPESWAVVPDSDDRVSATDSEPRTASPAVPLPSLRIQSSTVTHQHIYWLLDELQTNYEEVENRNRTITLAVGGDTSSWDITQVLRPPDTINYGYAKPERHTSYPVFIEEFDKTRSYSTESFSLTKDFRPLVKERLGEIPSIISVLALQNWDPELLSYFQAGPNPSGDGKGRSYQMMAIAYNCAEHGFTDEQIYSVLYDCDERWGAYKFRTDRDRRLVDIVERARAKHPFTAVELTFQGLAGTENEAGDVLQTVFTLDQFLSTELHIDWIFQGLLPIHGYGIIAGPPGVGKSQLGLILCDSIVSNRPFLHQWELKRQGLKVMFLSLEMSHPELKFILETFQAGGDYAVANRDRLTIVPIGEDIPLDRPEGQRFLETLLKEHRPDLLIIDSLAKAMYGKITDDNAVFVFNRYLSRIRHKYGMAIVVIHHNRKVQDKRFQSDELDDLYGSRFLSQDASFVLMMNYAKYHGQISVNPAKTRFSAPPETKLTMSRRSDLMLNYQEIGIGDGLANDESSPGDYGDLTNPFGAI